MRPTPWTTLHVKLKKLILKRTIHCGCYSEYRSSSVSQAGPVAFHWVQLLICKIRMKLFCCPHQSRQSLLEYWWPADGLLPLLPSLDTPIERRERGSVLLDLSWENRSTIWPWDRQIGRLFLFSSFLFTHFYSERFSTLPFFLPHSLLFLPPSP